MTHSPAELTTEVEHIFGIGTDDFPFRVQSTFGQTITILNDTAWLENMRCPNPAAPQAYKVQP